jgi:Ca2+-binding EF-hand superfamily protein
MSYGYNHAPLYNTEGAAPENLFATIDADESGDLTKEEINAWFQAEQHMDMPDELMEREDKDANGIVTWEEFSGPKGPARDEL